MHTRYIYWRGCEQIRRWPCRSKLASLPAVRMMRNSPSKRKVQSGKTCLHVWWPALGDTGACPAPERRSMGRLANKARSNPKYEVVLPRATTPSSRKDSAASWQVRHIPIELPSRCVCEIRPGLLVRLFSSSLLVRHKRKHDFESGENIDGIVVVKLQEHLKCGSFLSRADQWRDP